MENLAQNSELPPQVAAFDHDIMLCNEMKEECHDCHSVSWQPVKNVISEEDIKTEFVDLVHDDMQMIKSTKGSTSDCLTVWKGEEIEEYETNIICENGIDRNNISEVVDVKTEQPDNLVIIDNRNEDIHVFNVDKKVEVLIRESDNLNEKLRTLCKEEEAAAEMGVSQMRSSNTPHTDHTSDSVQVILKQETKGSETNSENNQSADSNAAAVQSAKTRTRIHYRKKNKRKRPFECSVCGLHFMSAHHRNKHSVCHRGTHAIPGGSNDAFKTSGKSEIGQRQVDGGRRLTEYMIISGARLGMSHSPAKYHDEYAVKETMSKGERLADLQRLHPFRKRQKVYSEGNNAKELGIQFIQTADKSSRKRTTKVGKGSLANTSEIFPCDMCHQVFSDPAYLLKHVGKVHHHGNLQKENSSNTAKRKASYLQRESNTLLSRSNGMNFSIPTVRLCKLKVQPLEMVNVNLNCIPICPLRENHFTEQSSGQQVAQDCNVSSIPVIRKCQSVPLCSKTFVKDNKYENSDLERRQECEERTYTVGTSCKIDVNSSATTKRKASFHQRESSTPMSRSNGKNYSIPTVSLCKLKVQPPEMVNINLNCIPICPLRENHLTEQNCRWSTAHDCSVSSIPAIRQFQSIAACSKTFVKDVKYENSDLERRQECAVKCDKKISTIGKSHKNDICSVGFVLTGSFIVHKGKHTVKKWHVCHVCGVGFADPIGLKIHKRIHTGEKPHQCDVCGAAFSKKGNLQCHKRIHTGEKPYKCDICGVSYADHSSLKCHKRRHTGEKPFKCDVCGVKFSYRSSLYRHKRIHTGEKPYKCDVCGAAFSLADYLQEHKRIHTGEKPYECDVCGVPFASRGTFKAHKRRHTGEKPFECDVCDVKFSYVSSLHRHKRIHTGEKPYECDVCGGSFCYLGMLKKHKRIHTGEKPYKCDICCVAYSDSFQLKIHKRKHTGWKPNLCDVCGVGFADPVGLNLHKRIHTGEKPHHCDVCGAAFSRGGNLRRHKRIHTGEKPYKCGICGVSYAAHSTLQYHKRRHTGEKPHQCDVCGADFSSRASLQCHKRIHTGEKPYKCDICGASFAAPISLHRHKRTHTGEKPQV